MFLFPVCFAICQLHLPCASYLTTRKAPGALDPAVVPPPPGGGVKYVTATQDKSPWLCSERHDDYFFGRAKTGGLGQVTTKEKNHGKKRVLLDPVLTAG